MTEVIDEHQAEHGPDNEATFDDPEREVSTRSLFTLLLVAQSGGFVLGFYNAFVAQSFWNWFAVPVTHVGHISYFQMLGLWWLIWLLGHGNSWPGKSEAQKIWTLMGVPLKLCIPESRKHLAREHFDGLRTTARFEAITAFITVIVVNTALLLAGFLLHIVSG